MRFDDVARLLAQHVGPLDEPEAKAKKRMRIIEAATELFIEQGYRKTTIDEVASRAGIAKGTLYLYFATKVDVLIAALAVEKSAFLHRLRPLFDEGLPARERMRTWLATVFASAGQMPIVSRLMKRGELMALYDELPEGLAQQQEQLRLEFLGDVVEELSDYTLSHEQVAERINVIFGLMHFSAMLVDSRVRFGLSLERFAEVLGELVVGGLSMPPSSNTGEES